MLVDTVPFPAYTREIIQKVGFYDEELVRNQDDEYNYRIRKLGGKILLAPDVKSKYYSRSSIRKLWSQYFQYGYWLRLFPEKVEYFVSEDGKDFDMVGSVTNTLPIDQYGGQQRDFISEFEPRNARYVKVIAYTIGNTPDWHPGAGRPANITVDEIVVE